MRTSKLVALILLASQATWVANAQTDDRKCSVPLFRGATQPQGGEAQMRVVNNGQACGIRNFGSFPNLDSLAHAGEITVPPKNGLAKFEAPRALYTPLPGFAGEDYFEYSATAKGHTGNLVALRVKVHVVVVAE